MAETSDGKNCGLLRQEQKEQNRSLFTLASRILICEIAQFALALRIVVEACVLLVLRALSILNILLILSCNLCYTIFSISTWQTILLQFSKLLQ